MVNCNNLAHYLQSGPVFSDWKQDLPMLKSEENLDVAQSEDCAITPLPGTHNSGIYPQQLNSVIGDVSPSFAPEHQSEVSTLQPLYESGTQPAFPSLPNGDSCYSPYYNSSNGFGDLQYNPCAHATTLNEPSLLSFYDCPNTTISHHSTSPPPLLHPSLPIDINPVTVLSSTEQRQPQPQVQLTIMKPVVIASIPPDIEQIQLQYTPKATARVRHRNKPGSKFYCPDTKCSRHDSNPFNRSDNFLQHLRSVHKRDIKTVRELRKNVARGSRYKRKVLDGRK